LFLGIPVRWVERDARLLSHIVYGTPETLGLDRVIAAVGAAHHFPAKPVVVIDAGSAVTIDFVDASGKFSGGVIAPGLSAFEAGLAQKAPALPPVRREIPAFFPGDATISCLEWGISGGFVLMIEGFLRRYQTITAVHVITTGGDGAWLARHLAREFAPVFVPALIFDGLSTWFD
jgi:type III pantothenate kinase